MTKPNRSFLALAAVLSISCAVSLAQSSGEATYMAKCQGCHGATGLAGSPVAKVMQVKPVTDPEVKKMAEAQMIEITKNGKEKMQAFKDKLTDAQIKDAVDYFRALAK
jgi:mono/diheme cytochrome c family protein